MRRLRIAVEEDQVVFVDFEYERLPALCCCYGLIGHNDSDYGLAIRMKREGVTNPAQYGKWIRAPMRQKVLRDNGGNGGRGDRFKQLRATRKAEERRIDGDGDGQDKKVDTTEEARDKTVISNPKTIERENLPKSHEFLEKSEGASGKEKGDLTKTVTTHHKEKEVMMTDEMAWQKAEEERRPPNIGNECSNNKILGR